MITEQRNEMNKASQSRCSRVYPSESSKVKVDARETVCHPVSVVLIVRKMEYRASLEQSLPWLSFFMLTGLLLSFILNINDNLASLGLAQLEVRIQHNALPSPTPCWWGNSSGHTQAGVGANIVLLHPAFGLEAFSPHSDSLLTPTTHQRRKKYVPSAHIAPFISP